VTPQFYVQDKQYRKKLRNESWQEWRLQMTNAQDKRRTGRRTVDTPILCSYFNDLDSASARTVNFSTDGMYFVSDREFIPGSAVLIRAKNGSPHPAMPENTEGLRQTTLAEVRWCRQISTNPAHYQVGVKYYESWY
jgi:hypothetical protein